MNKILFLILTLARSVFAQDVENKPIKLCVNYSGNFANMKELSSFNYHYSFLYGNTVYAGVKLSIKDRFVFETGISRVVVGQKMTGIMDLYGDIVSFKNKSQKYYISIPVLVNITLIKSNFELYCTVGPTVNLFTRIYSETTFSNNKSAILDLRFLGGTNKISLNKITTIGLLAKVGYGIPISTKINFISEFEYRHLPLFRFRTFTYAIGLGVGFNYTL